MEDFNFIYYILAFIIYALTRRKKKKNEPSRPQQQRTTKTFEELLKEITQEQSTETERPESEPVEAAEVVDARVEERRREVERKREERLERERATRLEGERRAFADDESKRIYEESIKQAEGFDIDFAAADNYKKPELFKKYSDKKFEREKTEHELFLESIRNGLGGSEAKKAVIYSEILNRRY